MLTRQDEENYGAEFLDLTRRAAHDAVGPQLAELRAQNAQLRRMAVQSQTANIQAALDRDLPHWRQIFANPAFANWLEEPDDYSNASRSQLLRNAVSNGDVGRIAAIYRGFERSGRYTPAAQQRSQQSRPAGGKPVYSRPQIADLYKRRRDGLIDDATWAHREADIFAASREGRIIGAIGPDGTELTRWAR
jgi:hypothetical protein